jgi:hypothetical protein
LNPMRRSLEKEKSSFITIIHAQTRQRVTRLLCISQYRRLQKCVSSRRRAGRMNQLGTSVRFGGARENGFM